MGWRATLVPLMRVSVPTGPSEVELVNWRAQLPWFAWLPSHWTWADCTLSDAPFSKMKTHPGIGSDPGPAQPNDPPWPMLMLAAGPSKTYHPRAKLRVALDENEVEL